MRKFFPGDVVQYDMVGDRVVAVVAGCPEQYTRHQWAVDEGTVWIYHPHNDPDDVTWVSDIELTLISRPLSILTKCDTMGTSTNDTKETTMFTLTQAATILSMINDRAIGGLTDEELAAVVALRQFANSKMVNLMMSVQPTKFVAGIKLIREITGLGLKEAKDLYDSLDPHHYGGNIGPVVTMIPRDEAEGLVRRYNGMEASLFIQQ